MTDARIDGTETLFRRLLATACDVHMASPDLCNFADWPTDLAYVAPHPRSIPVLPQIRAMADEGALQAALAAVVDHADWIQTYSEAEEAYLVISGRCLFEAEGAEPAELGVGGVRIHASYQKHTMEMRDAPMLALCLWRGAGMSDRAHLA